MNLKNKKIVVTGGTGHLGSFLVKKLDCLGAKVIVIHRKKKDNGSLSKNIKFVQFDISDIKSVVRNKNYLDNAHYLIHLAAFVPKAQDNISEDIKTNVAGTINLAKNSSKNTKLIYISTAEVYGKNKYLPIDEEHPCRPLTSYGATKLMAEKKLLSLYKNNSSNLTILRLASVYGPGEIIPRAIPNFISSVLNSQAPIIYGDGSDKRDYLYIDDAVDAILCAIVHNVNGIYNISSGKYCTIKQIAKKIIKMSNKSLKPIFKRRAKQKFDFVFDISKAKKYLSFQPKTNIEDGLRKEMIWHLINKAKTIYIDFDGTVINVFDRLYKVHQDAMERLDLEPIKKSEYLELKRRGIPEKRIIEKNYDKSIFEKYNALRLGNIEKKSYLDLDKINSNTIASLLELKNNHRLVLVTNRKSKKLFFYQIRKLRLSKLFDDFLFSRYELLGKDSVIIGDSEEDILTAKRLGVPVIAVQSGLRNSDFLLKYKPNLIIRDLAYISSVASKNALAISS